MSGRGRAGDTSSKPHAVAPYEVGYGKPPAQHRFAKGQSGNPGGRPRKARKPDIPKARGLGCASQLSNQIMLAEGNRQVTFRENGKVIQLSAMQLVIRAAYAAAMRGDRWALRLLMERTQQIESSDREERIENFTMMVEYQTAGRHAIAKARTAGLPDPEMLPHPDDIVIDMVTGDTTICGPVTLEDKAAWDDMLTSRDSIQKVVSYCAQEYRRASGAARKAELLDSWHEVQARYDMINGNLPPRYRKELADRSLAEGATFPGSQKARDWPGE